MATAQLDGFLLLSSMWMRRGGATEASYYCRKALQLCQRMHSSQREILVLLQLARLRVQLGRLDAALEFHASAQDALDQLGAVSDEEDIPEGVHERALIEVWSGITKGIIFHYQGQSADALKCYQAAQKVSSRLKQPCADEGPVETSAVDEDRLPLDQLDMHIAYHTGALLSPSIQLLTIIGLSLCVRVARSLYRC